MKKLKVGFLVDGFEVSSNVLDLIQHVENSDLFCRPVIIHGQKKTETVKSSNKTSALTGKSSAIEKLNKIAFSLLYRLVRKLELNTTKKQYPNYRKKFDIRSLLSFRELVLQGQWSPSGLYLSFTEADIRILSQENLDCIVRCGSGILKGKILDVAKHGVLSFHHGDNRVIRGGPSGFWEVLNDLPSSGFIIQRLNEELDGGAVLVRGNIMTSGTWTSNNAALLEKSNFFLKDLLDRIARTGKLPRAEGPRLHSQPLFKLKSARTLASYLKKRLVQLIQSKIINKLLTRNVTRWSIAYAEHNNLSKSLWRYKEIENPKGRFLADPFIFGHAGRKIVFVEDFFYSDRKGRISAIELKDGTEDFIGVVLEEEFHLSFPFILEDQSNIYMVPDTHQSGEIRLYKCLEFPKKWELEKVLMKNVSAVDTMMIRRDNLYFMLTNICSAGLGDYGSELHIFYSAKIDSDEWTPIESGNPVIFDSLSARNGGMFYSNGELYRVNQIHGKCHYGKSFGVNRISVLNEREYSEERVSTVDAKYKKGLHSTHHFNADAEIAVVDYCRLQRLRIAKKQ